MNPLVIKELATQFLKKSRMTSQEFAYKCGVGTSTVYRICQGQQVTKTIARKIDAFTNGEIPYNLIVKDD